MNENATDCEVKQLLYIGVAVVLVRQSITARYKCCVMWHHLWACPYVSHASVDLEQQLARQNR